eukprot:16390_6
MAGQDSASSPHYLLRVVGEEVPSLFCQQGAQHSGSRKQELICYQPLMRSSPVEQQMPFEPQTLRGESRRLLRLHLQGASHHADRSLRRVADPECRILTYHHLRRR